MNYLLLTHPGLEDLVRDELLDLAPAARVDPRRIPGALVVDSADVQTLFRLTMVLRVIALRHSVTVRSLDDVRSASVACDWPELAAAASFRVRAARSGDHSFTRIELAAAAGGALHTRYNTTVDLDNGEVEVRAELIDEQLFLGLSCHRGSLGNRTLRPRPLRTALQPVVAAAMIRISGAHRGHGRLIDPMCGSATVPIEARRINPALRLEAADWDAPTVQVARETLSANGVDLRPTVADVRELGRNAPGAYDAIVSDPPYGLRQAARIPLASLYRPMLQSLEAALAAQGTIVLIVLKQRTFEHSLAETQLVVRARREVDLGRIRAAIFALRHPNPTT